MKKYIISAITMMLVAGLGGLAISSVNKLTTPIIEENTRERETKLCKSIFSDFDGNNSLSLTTGFNDPAIIKKVIVKNSSNIDLGVVYTVSGKNSYGAIVLLVGIDTHGKLVSVEFLENGQSFANEVNSHVKSEYSGGLTADNIITIDTNCGATYGAKTVKELVTIAFNDYNGGVDNE